MSNSNKLITGQLNEDLQKLSESFNSLKDATSQIAADTHVTVITLKDRLQDTTYRFFSVIDAINDIVVIKDGNGRWQTVNTRAKELYGFTFDDYFECTDEELSITHPQYRDGLLNCIKSDEIAWQTKTYYRDIESFEVDGRILYFDVIKTPRFNSDGSRKELIVIGRDITELREKDYQTKTLMTALDTSSDSIFIFNDSGNITFCNNTFVSLFKFKDNASAIETPFKDLGLTKIYDSMLTVIRTNKIWSDIIKLEVNDEIITGILTIVPMMNGKPKPILYICTLKMY